MIRGDGVLKRDRAVCREEGVLKEGEVDKEVINKGRETSAYTVGKGPIQDQGHQFFM
jgi:hypothetical protein